VSIYAISLFLHIVGALGLCAVLVLEWAGLLQIRRATGTAQVREWSRLLAAPRRVGGPVALVILLTGVHLSATRWGPQGWIIVGLGGMVAIAALGAALGGRRVGAIIRGIPAEDGPIPTALDRQLHDPVLVPSLCVRTALFLGTVFLMATKPSAAGSLAAMGVAAAAGVAAALPHRSRGRRQAPLAGSER
jgi:hypothetical protein